MHKESVNSDKQHSDHIRKGENTCGITAAGCCGLTHDSEVPNTGTSLLYCFGD